MCSFNLRYSEKRAPSCEKFVIKIDWNECSPKFVVVPIIFESISILQLNDTAYNIGLIQGDQWYTEWYRLRFEPFWQNSCIELFKLFNHIVPLYWRWCDDRERHLQFIWAKMLFDLTQKICYKNLDNRVSLPSVG